jgi:hypothetical protein
VPVFFSAWLSEFLSGHRLSMENEVRAIEPEALVRTSRAELEHALVDKYRLDPPDVDFEAKRQLPKREQRMIPSRYGGPPISRSTLAISVHVPCSGNIDLLRYCPSRYTLSDFSAETDGASSLVFEFEVPLGDPTEMTREIDGQINERLRYWPEMVRTLRAEVETFNEALPASVKGTVEHFLDEAQRFAKAQDMIDIPLLERRDAVAEAISLTPKRIALPAPSLREPNPHLDDVSYGMLLDRLRIMGQAIERVPGPFVDLPEEALRFFFLVVLNSQFGLEGTATGETFNAGGKTDVLIRWSNQNLFVAECKVWDGETTVAEAIEQLFGYLTIRDLRAAILLFVRTRDFTKTMSTAIARAKKHDCFERDDGAPEDEARLVFHLPQDHAKKVTVALLGFHVYKRPGRAVLVLDQG